jgi:hypothetical protein
VVHGTDDSGEDPSLGSVNHQINNIIADFRGAPPGYNSAADDDGDVGSLDESFLPAYDTLSGDQEMSMYDVYQTADPLRTWERVGDRVVAMELLAQNSQTRGLNSYKNKSKGKSTIHDHDSNSDDSGVSGIWIDSHDVRDGMDGEDPTPDLPPDYEIPLSNAKGSGVARTTLVPLSFEQTPSISRKESDSDEDSRSGDIWSDSQHVEEHTLEDLGVWNNDAPALEYELPPPDYEILENHLKGEETDETFQPNLGHDQPSNKLHVPVPKREVKFHALQKKNRYEEHHHS